MSLAVWETLKRYAAWRESYFRKYPEKRLFAWLEGGLHSIPAPEDPIITIGPAGEKIKNMGILAVLAIVAVLALGNSE